MKRTILAGLSLSALLQFSCLAASGPFNPDTDPSRMAWTQIPELLGPAPDVRGKRFGVVLKTLTNEYWRLMAAGYRRRAAADGVKLDIQAAQNEDDQIRQLAMMENMIGSRYTGLLVSPQSASNLQPAIDDAAAAGIPMVDVDGAVVDSIMHFVGAVNSEMGMRVARWFIRAFPNGGKVAVIEGQADVFSTIRRTAGFREALAATGKFKVVATMTGNWDHKQARDATLAILRQTPDLVGLYCNNDTMALGAVEAVKSLGLLAQVRVFGTDGTQEAYQSIRAGELTGTVDIFPALVGEIGLEIAERLSVGQVIPRVIKTPQAVITRDTIDRYQGSGEAVRRALLNDETRDH